MSVLVRPLNMVGGGQPSFQGWDGVFSSQGISSIGKNNVFAFLDSETRRYIGDQFPSVSVNLLESSLKTTPTTWATSALPTPALSIRDLAIVAGLSPDTMVVATNNTADGRVYKFEFGVGYTNLNFPERTTSDAVVSVVATSDPDVFLVGNQCQAAGGAPAVWTLQLSTVTWTKVGGLGLGGSWNVSTTNKNCLIVFALGVAFVMLGGGTANLLQVWRSDASFTNWTQIGGNSLFGSWAPGTKRNGRLSFANGILYAGIGGATAGTDAEAWQCLNPASATPIWSKIGDPTVWTSGTITTANAIVALADKVVIGTSGSVAGNSELWQFDVRANARTWSQIAVGSWSRTQTGRLYVSPFDNSLWVGVGNNSTGTALFYQAPGGRLSPGGSGGFQFQLYSVKV